MLDLNHVAIFLRVVEAGSFTAAGKLLGLPKSTVSRSVAKLEAGLGTQLLQRTTRSLKLTDSGALYYDHARQALAGIEEANVTVARLDSEPAGIVRLTAPADLDFINGILARFLRQYPKVHVELTITNRMVNLIEEGIDLAVRAGRLDDSSLIARRVGPSELGVFASRDYLERRGWPSELAALTTHDCILFRTRTGRAVWHLSREEGPIERVEVRGPLSVDDMVFVRHAVVSGIGIGVFPVVHHVAHPDQALVRLFPEYAMRAGALYVVMPAASHKPKRITLLRDHLVTELVSMRCANQVEEPETRGHR